MRQKVIKMQEIELLYGVLSRLKSFCYIAFLLHVNKCGLTKRKMRLTQMCHTQKCLEIPLASDYTSESVPVNPQNKMYNFTAERNLFTTWYKKTFPL